MTDVFFNMKKTYILLFILIGFFLNTSAKDPINVAKCIANHILTNHSNTLSMNKDGSSHINSYYQEWRYVNGVLGLSMLSLSEVTSDSKYEDFVKENYNFFFDKNIHNKLQAEYDRGVRDNAWRRFFSMSSLDDCGAMGAALSELNNRHPRKCYQDYLNRIGKYILTIQQRIKIDGHDKFNGIFCRGNNGDRTIWLDDLYMCCSFLTHESSKNNDSKGYLDTAVHQVILYDSLLYDNKVGLYWHCFYYDAGHCPGTAHWGRANGWSFLAQTLVLGRIAENNPYRQKLLNIFRDRIRNICCYQDSLGMWHQLLDKPDSYPETSCTAMFIYAIAKGILNGWIDTSYATVAQKGWEAVCRNVTKDGQLRNVCIGTGISRDLPFYYSRPTPLNDAHGLGAVILAGIEMEYLEQMINEKSYTYHK